MSASPRVIGTGSPANCATSHLTGRVARALHDRCGLRGLGFLLASCMAGCIIPPSLSVDVQDAGIDSPPSITSVRSDLKELPEPGPVSFAAAPDASSATINLTLLDTDIGDTLYARIYVDYKVDQPTNARSECLPAPSNGSAVRTTTCSASAICLQSDISTTPDHIMEIVVFDRAVLTGSAQPQFRAIPPDGQSTTRTYQLNCTSGQ
ncbi:MAG: hypothetical protein ABI467_26690 [Kofleriaceae bacterium]